MIAWTFKEVKTMAIKINFESNNLIPSKMILGEAITIGIIAVLISFLLDFFGLQIILNWVPKGWEVLILIILSVYVKHLLIIRWKGKEVI